MGYNAGFCKCCGEKVMVRDVNGRLCSKKPNYVLFNFSYENSPVKVKSYACRKCFDAGNIQELMRGTIASEIDARVVEMINSLGSPSSVQEIKTTKGREQWSPQKVGV